MSQTKLLRITDALLGSASISGFVILADIVFRRTYIYVKAIRKAPKEISALFTEIGALRGSKWRFLFWPIIRPAIALVSSHLVATFQIE